MPTRRRDELVSSHYAGTASGLFDTAHSPRSARSGKLQFMGRDELVPPTGLFTAWLDCRDGRQVCRNVVCRERLHIHLDETHKWAPEIGVIATAAINDDANRRNLASFRVHDIDRFLYSSATGDHVLGHHESFALVDLEASPKNQPTLFLLSEDVSFTQRATDFLSDNDAPERGRNHCVAFNVP